MLDTAQILPLHAVDLLGQCGRLAIDGSEHCGEISLARRSARQLALFVEQTRTAALKPSQGRTSFLDPLEQGRARSLRRGSGFGRRGSRRTTHRSGGHRECEREKGNDVCEHVSAHEQVPRQLFRGSDPRRLSPSTWPPRSGEKCCGGNDSPCHGGRGHDPHGQGEVRAGTLGVVVAQPPNEPPTLAPVPRGQGPAESTPSGFLPPDEVLGRYVVLHRLGAGGMGVVYAAYDPKLDRKVALKLLRKSSSDPKKRERGQARLMAEARALARLSHPNVIAVHDVAVHGSRIVVAMEFVDGDTLTVRLARSLMPWRDVVDLMKRAGRGLAAAHDAGLVHRDFKPDNVMLGRDGRVHVMDFGLARDFDLDEAGNRVPLHLTGNHGVLGRSRLAGTPAYMAPEQHRGEPVDGRSDQFSFCVTFYEALYGHRPFAGEGSEGLLQSIDGGHISAPPPHVKVPSWVRAIVLRGLASDPDARYPTMHALLDDLARIPGARRRRAFAGAGVVGTVGLMGGLFALREDEPTTPPCVDASARLEGVWDEPLKREIQASFEAVPKPYVSASWSAVQTELDGYADSWLAAHFDACEATRVRFEQSDALLDLRMECLNHRLDEMAALTDLLARADAEVVQTGVAASAKLVPVSVCADVGLLTAPVPVPNDPEVRERVRGLRSSLARVKVHEDAGRYARGLALAKVAVERARLVGYAPALAESLYREARLAIGTGDVSRAEPLLREAIQTASAGHDDLIAAMAWTALVGVVGHGQARGERAEEIIAAAKAAVGRAGSSPELQAELATVTGATRLQQGRLEEARDQFQLALERQRSVVESGHASLARLHNNVAAVALLLQDRDSAKRHLQQAIEIQERTHGPQHPSVGPMKANYGGVLLVQGRTREAEEFLEQALKVWENGGARHRSFIGQAQVSLAQIDIYEGRLDEAESTARKALVTVEPIDGSPHPDVAQALAVLGTALQRQGRSDEALDVLERAQSISKSTLVEDHDLNASVLTDLGIAQTNAGSIDEGLENLERALKIRVARPGFSTELPRLRFAMARTLLPRDRERALRLARAARAGYQALPREHPMRRVLNDVDAWIARNTATSTRAQR